MPEDRDQLFEKALLRHFCADATGQSLCLDPELLAAYYERTLRPEEMAAAKLHMASCARCREIVAQLESTRETSELREAPEMARLDAVPPAPAKIPVEMMALAATAKTKSISESRAWSLGSLVPAGALAAGLLLWIGFTVFRTHPKFNATPMQAANNRSEEPARQDSLDAASSAEVAKSALEERRPASGMRDANTDAKLSQNEPAPSNPGMVREYSRRAAVPRAPGPNAPAAQAQGQVQRSAPADDSSAPLERSTIDRAAGQVAMASEVPAFDSPQTQAQMAKSAVAGVAGGPVPPASSPSSRPASGPSAAALSAKKDTATGKTSDLAVYNAVATKTELDIRVAAPGGKAIWSVGANGQILFSQDSGRTWILQFTGITAALTGGSAPSDKVCWIAGAAGTLLLTTDGGQHWHTVATPITGDLGGVHAADALHASIWDLPNHAGYETADGGASWKPAANE
jgi:hypothetical protein